MSGAITELPVTANGIFLSYSHRDAQAALGVKQELERRGVRVRLDTEIMQAGQGIQAFILESIRATVATVWIVSEASLTSDWVACEIMMSLRDAELWRKRRLVACYLDEGFLDKTFRLRATAIIDQRIAEIDALVPQYVVSRIDTNDLNADKSRLFRLRNDLGTLLEHLRGSLCLDVRAGQAEANLGRLAKALRLVMPAQQPPLAAAGDLEQRREEIYGLIASNDGERALNRLMDFVKDFSEDRRRRDVVIMMMNYRRLESVQGASLREVRLERTRLIEKALALLDDTVDTLTRKVA